MPIYHDGKKMKPYRGYRKPVNIYYGDKKVAGWHNITATTFPATLQTTYNDTADILVSGNTVQQSEWVNKTGLLSQDGTPTPETPISLVSNLPAGTYKVADYWGHWYEFTTNSNIGGKGAVLDSIEFDRVSHNGFERRYWNSHLIVLNDIVSMYAPSNYNLDYAIIQMPNDSKKVYNSATTLLTHGAISTNAWGDISDVNKYRSYDTLTQKIAYGVPKGTTLEQAKTLLSGAIVAYRLDTPTRATLTFTLNDSSTAPECPMEFLTNAPSLNYPAEIWDAEGEVTVENIDGSQIVTAAIEILRSNQDGTVYDELNVATGKVTRRIGRIESYNGESVGDDWISSTGSLDNGAVVKYVLATPTETTVTSVIMPTYYPTTIITTTNNNVAQLTTTATVKVEDEELIVYELTDTDGTIIIDTENYIITSLETKG